MTSPQNRVHPGVHTHIVTLSVALCPAMMEGLYIAPLEFVERQRIPDHVHWPTTPELFNIMPLPRRPLLLRCTLLSLLALGLSPSLLQRVGDFDGHFVTRSPDDSDRLKVLDNPVGPGRDNLVHGVTRDEADDLAAGRLSGLDARGRVLQHQDVPRHVLQAELLEAHEVAGRVGLPVLHRLGGDEVLRYREGEDVEPAGDKGLGARGDNGPGAGLGYQGVQQRPRSRNLGGIVAV